MGVRAPRERLSRDRVLAAAMGIADAEGLDAVTMRRIASDLEVEAMSLYHHLPGKEALLDGLVDAVVGEIQEALAPTEDPEDDWRTSLRRRCLTAREVMLRHPWAPAVMGSRTSIPASAYAHYEAVLATLVAGGFSYHLAHQAIHALGSMALGFVQELFSPAPSDEDPDVDQAEMDMAAMAEAFPHMTAMVASEIHDNDGDMLGWCDSQSEFEFTLDLLLDGLARARAGDGRGARR